MADGLFDRVAGELQADPAVRRAPVFGHPGLKLGRRLFACEFDGDLVVKLGEERAGALLAAGRAEPFDPMGSRPIRAWARVPVAESGDPYAVWLELAAEAHAYVATEDA